MTVRSAQSPPSALRHSSQLSVPGAALQDRVTPPAVFMIAVIEGASLSGRNTAVSAASPVTRKRYAASTDSRAPSASYQPAKAASPAGTAVTVSISPRTRTQSAETAPSPTAETVTAAAAPPPRSVSSGAMTPPSAPARV